MSYQMFVKIVQPRVTLMTPSFSCLKFTLNDSARVIESVNTDLQRIRNWYFDNCLMLNPDNTSNMVSDK